MNSRTTVFMKKTVETTAWEQYERRLVFMLGFALCDALSSPCMRPASGTIGQDSLTRPRVPWTGDVACHIN